MAHSLFTGIELSGHYIEVGGPVTELELLDVLQQLVGPESVERPACCPPLLILGGGRTIVFVDVGPEPDDPATLAVGNLDGDDEARERAAEAICCALGSTTRWRLHCSTDDGSDVPCMPWAC